MPNGSLKVMVTEEMVFLFQMGWKMELANLGGMEAGAKKGTRKEREGGKEKRGGWEGEGKKEDVFPPSPP